MADDDSDGSRRLMTNWYNPWALLQIAIRAGSATIFGRMFDRRETMASLDETILSEIDSRYTFKREDNSDFWFDYVADLGEGWRSTFTVARLLARDELAATADAEKLTRGHVLIFGGDQVYPTPSKQDYKERLAIPYQTAQAVEI
jgi:hypothetical protein